LQRLSSLAFGTRAGRLLTLYAILPFGGAFVVLEGLQHALNLVLPSAPGPPDTVPASPAEDDNGSAGLPAIVRASAARETEEPALHLATPVSVVLLGLFLLALLHSPAFRRLVWHGTKLLYRGIRSLFIDVPWFLLHLPVVRAVLDSRVFIWFKQWIL